MAMKIDDDSCDCAKSELELFRLPPTQTSINGCRYEKRGPTTALERGGPIEFKVHVGDDEYIDPNDTWLYLKAKIVSAKGEALKDKPDDEPDGVVPDNSLVFPIANFIGSMFRQIDVSLNGKQVASNDGLYAYRSYMETLLTYGSEPKKHQLSISMFCQDQSELDVHDESILGTTKNKGAKERFERTKFSKSFECVGPIHSEIFEQSRLLLNKVEMNVKFTRNDENFILMSKNKDYSYKILLEEATLYAGVKQIASHVRLAHEERLLSTNAKYPVRRVNMKFFTKGPLRSDISEPNLTSGIIPRRIVFGLVSTEAFNGSKHKNPFNFQNFGITYVALLKNGRAVPYNGMNLNFGYNGEFFIAYRALMHSTGMWKKNHSNAIVPTRDYKHGFTLFAFNLLPDQSEGANFNLQEEGTLSLDIRLGKGVDESITIICYLEYDNIMEIDKDRQIHYHE